VVKKRRGGPEQARSCEQAAQEGRARRAAEISAPDIDRCIGKYVYEKTFSGAACVASVGTRIFHRAAYGSPASRLL